MGEIISTLVKSLIKFSAIIAVMMGFIAVFTVAVSGVSVLMNKSVLNDLLSLVQMWAPFNLGPILLWLGTAAGLYITYRVANYGYNMFRTLFE